MFKINKKNSFNMTLLLLSLWSKTLRSYSETMSLEIHRCHSSINCNGVEDLL